MMGMEWFKPAIFFGSMAYAVMGVVVFWVCFMIVEKRNMALAVVVAAMCLGIAQIIAAAVHG